MLNRKPAGNEAPTASLLAEYLRVRARSEAICAPLQIEDYGVQPMPDASPPKWHLAHTSWFFETFLLRPYLADYQPFDPQFEYLFNSYYNGVGSQFPRTMRGTLSRPTVAEVRSYRQHVDTHMSALLSDQVTAPDILQRVVVGLHHEEQHQELIFTDLKYNLGNNPLRPSYQAGAGAQEDVPVPPAMAFVAYPGGLSGAGREPAEVRSYDDFAFDNESPEHQVFLQPFAMGNRLVTNGEYAQFIADGGYRRHELWLSDAWSTVRERDWQAPLYWCQQDGQWAEYRLSGLAPLLPGAPVTHVSLYEADAYARWADARLPSEFEWEQVARSIDIYEDRNAFFESGDLHPGQLAIRSDATEGSASATGSSASPAVAQMFGYAWQWTSSGYGSYPGFQPFPGTLGEYNGKFMANQTVLRGGSCVTPRRHFRKTYRNFFYPPDRWQFTGIRLARDV